MYAANAYLVLAAKRCLYINEEAKGRDLAPRYLAVEQGAYGHFRNPVSLIRHACPRYSLRSRTLDLVDESGWLFPRSDRKGNIDIGIVGRDVDKQEEFPNSHFPILRTFTLS